MKRILVIAFFLLLALLEVLTVAAAVIYARNPEVLPKDVPLGLLGAFLLGNSMALIVGVAKAGHDPVTN